MLDPMYSLSCTLSFCKARQIKYLSDKLGDYEHSACGQKRHLQTDDLKMHDNIIILFS